MREKNPEKMLFQFCLQLWKREFLFSLFNFRLSFLHFLYLPFLLHLPLTRFIPEFLRGKGQRPFPLKKPLSLPPDPADNGTPCTLCTTIWVKKRR